MKNPQEGKSNVTPKIEGETKLEVKVEKGKRCFRDGKGQLYEIYNSATTYDPYRTGGFDWCVGGAGNESSNPNTPFEFMVLRDLQGYVEDEDSQDGDNLFGYGGLHFSVKGWKKQLSELSWIPSEVKDAIEESILAGIEELKKNYDNYSVEVMKEILKSIEIGESK